MVHEELQNTYWQLLKKAVVIYCFHLSLYQKSSSNHLSKYLSSAELQ